MGTHFVEDVNMVSIFGKTNSENLTFFNHEQQEKKKKFLQAKEQREKETERQQLENEKRTKEYEEFSMREKIRQSRGNTGWHGRFYVPPKSVGTGRGTILNGTVHESIRSRGDIKPIGRGRLSPLEKQCLPLFERASKVQKNIDQHTESSLHNNNVQKVLWQGEEDDDFKDTFIPEDYTFSPVDPSPTGDQFEDALSNSQSASPISFKSVHNPAGGSPMTSGSLPQHPPAASCQTLQSQPPLASSSSVIRPWKSSKRMAAKFTNDYVEDDVYNENSCDVQKYIPEEEAIGAAGGKEDNYEEAGAYLESSGTPLMPSWNSRRTAGTSFNNLNSSQRVLSNDVLRPGQVFYARGGEPNSFNLNMKDFPPL